MSPLPLSLVSLTLVAGGAGERPETWDYSQEQLEAVGLGQSRGNPVVLSDELNPPIRGEQAVIYINFDGATLGSGQDNAMANTTGFPEFVGSYPSYGSPDGPRRQATYQAVLVDWEDFGVEIVDQRPDEGVYTMCLVGPGNPYGPGVLGVAPLDCGDWNQANISYAFHSESGMHDSAVQATTISQEITHTMGLEHVNEPGDILNPTNAGGDARFIDACISVVPGPGVGILCGEQHAEQCGSPNEQNSYQELLALFGPGIPDTAGPDIFIASPEDGTAYDVGDTAEVLVEATDDLGVSKVTLHMDGKLRGTDLTAPYEWTINDLEEGIHELEARAFDAGGNESSSEIVSLYVGVEPPEDPGPGSGTDGGGSGTGLPDPWGGDTAGEDGGEGGCGCSTDRPAPAAVLLLPLLLGLRRRR